jgi:S-(hydroxymethyl)glutathione dehydrogenase/alcohol dehydrogenase
VQAAVLTAHQQPLQLESLTAPDLGPSDVRLRIDASGVCHSDLTFQQGAIPYPTPVILGHEAAGTVIEVGRAVSRAAVGDRVICSFVPSCGDCWYCLHDQSNLCEGNAETMMATRGVRPDGTTIPGMSGLGTFADELVTAETMVVKVETDLPAEQLALIGCGITTGVGAALNSAAVRPGSTVAVIGCGGVGQSVIQGSRIAGAARIFAVDPIELKRTTAAALGATDLVDPADGDPVAQVRSMTDGRGADYAFEVIGRPETIKQAYDVARRGGTAVVVGMSALDASVTFSAVQLMADEKKLIGSLYGSAQVRRDFPRFVGLVETGRLDVGALVSQKIRLERVNDALTALERGEVIRSVICHP